MTPTNEEWVVIGGKGKPRRVGSQQQQQQQSQQATAVGICTTTTAAASQPPPKLAAAEAAGAAAAAAALPGWDSTPSTGVGGFAYSSSNNSRKANRRQQQQQEGRGSSSVVEQQIVKLQQQVHSIAQELRQSRVYQSLTAAMQQAAAAVEPTAAEDPLQQRQQQQQQQWDWSTVQQLVVYGLGSVEDSKVSKHQLAMVLLLQELLPGLQQPPQLYDPAFTPLDQQLLQYIGLAVIPVNEQGRRSIEGQQQTLFFLPHCEGVLCDNLLAANWSAGALTSLAILGNSFDSYHERWSGVPHNLRPTTTRPARLLHLVEQGVVRELPVPDHSYPVASAFNDMSLHTFTAAAAALADDDCLLGLAA